jgi:hypothetical protein
MSSVSENKYTYIKLVLVQAPSYSIPRSIELTFDQLFIDFFVSKQNKICYIDSVEILDQFCT